MARAMIRRKPRRRRQRANRRWTGSADRDFNWPKMYVAQLSCATYSNRQNASLTAGQCRPTCAIHAVEKQITGHRPLNRSAALNDPDQDDDDRQYQQNVNEPAQRIGSDQAQQPQDHQDDSDSPKQVHSSLLFPPECQSSVGSTPDPVTRRFARRGRRPRPFPPRHPRNPWRPLHACECGGPPSCRRR
jgi:hypothetical protein